jgi:hypothetical protein
MLMDKIAADMKDAMRAKDVARLSTLRLLKSAVEYHKIEKKQEQLTDIEVTAVIKKQIKQRQDSIEGFEKGGRDCRTGSHHQDGHGQGDESCPVQVGGPRRQSSGEPACLRQPCLTPPPNGHERAFRVQ